MLPTVILNELREKLDADLVYPINPFNLKKSPLFQNCHRKF
ncbi:hypothetical protein BGS_0463 [Beggiatoa sp. SS]|nr:hypothetical protein BGS_0463 [Beggiatoa sp. SS]